MKNYIVALGHGENALCINEFQTMDTVEASNPKSAALKIFNDLEPEEKENAIFQVADVTEPAKYRYFSFEAINEKKEISNVEIAQMVSDYGYPFAETLDSCDAWRNPDQEKIPLSEAEILDVVDNICFSFDCEEEFRSGMLW